MALSVEELLALAKKQLQLPTTRSSVRVAPSHVFVYTERPILPEHPTGAVRISRRVEETCDASA